MNAKQRKEYWMKTERLRAGLDKKYFEQVQKSVWDTFKRFARDIEVIGVDAARSRLGLDLWDKEMLKIFEAMYKESVLLFGNSVYRALRIEAQKAETFGFNREWTDAVLEFLLKQGFVLVADITSTTKKKLNDIVTKGIEEGLGVDQIVKLILSDENLAYSAMRARRIVRTEVMRSSNIGAMKGAEAHGFYVDKIWISARDKRTRRIPEDEFDHVKMDGQTQHFEDPFTSTGKKGEPVVAMQPGDITSPAGFTINCRCTVGFEGRRDANGRLLRKPKLGTPTIGGINQPTIPAPTIQVPKPTKTTAQVKQSVLNSFENNVKLSVKKISISKDIPLDELNARAEILDKLTQEYNLSPAIDLNYGTNITFKSTKRTYGFVRFLGAGRRIDTANFGDSSDTSNGRRYTPNYEGIRDKSRVDEVNIKLATTVHEFGHLITLSNQSAIPGVSNVVVQFYNELRTLRTDYIQELLKYNRDRDYYMRNEISLGNYASTNLDEFMAEAFTEYKLSSNPSKYATLVGNLMDKYFKK